MPRPQSQKDRAAAREAARRQRAAQQSSLAGRRRATLAVVVFVVIAALVLGLVGAVFVDTDQQSAGTTTTRPGSSTTTVVPVGDADLPVPEPGASISGPTPCPAEDGSSPRTTSFSEAPPVCIEPGRFYDAEIVTTKGRMLLQLNPEQAPGAVNNFVVLARYHYYDGQPFTAIFPREASVVRARFANPADVTSPGYRLPGETHEQIYPPGTIAFIPTSESDDSYEASFLLASFELAAGLPTNLTAFGIMLDGVDTLAAIDKAGSQQGTPAETVLIERITITAGMPMS